MTWTLVVKTWRDHWRGSTAWAVGLMAIIALQLWVYPSIRTSAQDMDALLGSYPEAFREFFRMSDFTSEIGFLNVEVFSLVAPLALIAVGTSWGAGATADEEEKGTADLLLTLPLSRSRVVLAKATATAGILLALAAVLTATLAVGGAIIDLAIPVSQFAAASVACALLGLLYSNVALLAGALVGRRGVAVGVTIALAITGYLTYSLSPMVDAFESINLVNPFDWALGPDPLSNGMDIGYSVRLLLLSLALAGVAAFAFNRRDIRSA